jgi:undecaprenyl phosphate N,N'-diacetylbacillosamine 1-phosphate transferase
MYETFFKPFFDRMFALLLLLLLSPVFMIISMLIYFKMGRPIFFVQKRPGKNKKIFSIYKFRTMTQEYDEEGVLLADEKRLQGLGRLIRSLSLDELPQLLNVLKGEMSFIGPRPLLIEYLPLYNEEQKRRHNVKPGITGWAQVNGRNAISWKKKFEYDLYYVDNISFLLDIKIYYLTLLKVLKREGVNAKDAVTTTPFKGNENE